MELTLIHHWADITLLGNARKLIPFTGYRVTARHQMKF